MGAIPRLPLQASHYSYSLILTLFNNLDNAISREREHTREGRGGGGDEELRKLEGTLGNIKG